MTWKSDYHKYLKPLDRSSLKWFGHMCYSDAPAGVPVERLDPRWMSKKVSDKEYEFSQGSCREEAEILAIAIERWLNPPKPINFCGTLEQRDRMNRRLIPEFVKRVYTK